MKVAGGVLLVVAAVGVVVGLLNATLTEPLVPGPVARWMAVVSPFAAGGGIMLFGGRRKGGGGRAAPP